MQVQDNVKFAAAMRSTMQGREGPQKDSLGEVVEVVMTDGIELSKARCTDAGRRSRAQITRPGVRAARGWH